MSQSASLRCGLLVVGLIASATAAAEAQKVVFDRTSGYRMTYIGQRVAARARVVDNTGRAIPGSPISFRIADPSVASVTPQGEVVSRKAGLTYVWAIARRDSASALILVEPSAAKFAFSPSVLRFDALGAKVPLRVRMSDAAGNPLENASSTTAPCRSLNDRIASLSAAGEVTSNGNGATYIRCTDRLIADSIRVDVQQRAIRATIQSKPTLARKTVGDTFSVRVNGVDRSQKVIVDVRPTWASLNPTVVSVDPLTGRARSLAAGPARVVAQIGDVADTVSIDVAPSPFSFAAVAAAPDSLAAAPTKGAPKLEIGQTYVPEGDTARLVITVRDSTGRAVPNARVTVRSGDPELVGVLDSMRVTGLKRGSAWIYVSYGALTDSTQVSVGLKNVAVASSGLAVETGTLVLPTIDSLGQRARYAAQRDSVLNAMIKSSEFGRATTGRLISGAGVASMAAHSSRPSATVVETRSGLMYGGVVSMAPFRRLILNGAFRLGDLQPPGNEVGEILSVKEAEANMTFMPVSAIGLRAGYVLRSENTPLSNQTWKFPRASVVTRFSFVGDALSTIADFSLLPAAQYSGATEKPSIFSLAGEAGLEFHTGAFNAGLTYYVERFNFDASPRIQQFSALRFRLGFQIGR